MDLQRYYHSFDGRVSATVAFGYDRSPAFRRRMEAAGLKPADIRGVEDLARLPVLHKRELPEVQFSGPDLGGMLTVPLSTLRRVFVAPGPIFTPEPHDPDSWRWGQAFKAAGFAQGEVVINCFDYHLSPAGMMFEQGARAAGCVVIPAGTDDLGRQVAAIAALGATAYIGLPSHLLDLLQKAEALGHNPRTWALNKAMVSVEPLPPSLRARFEQEYHVQIFEGYGAGETGSLGFSGPERKGWHLPADALVQICDLGTGAPLPPGQTGEVVVTLFRRDYIVVRLGIGDLSALAADGATSVISSPRLVGWLGRTADAVSVGGGVVHPRHVDEALLGMAGVAAYQVAATRRGGAEELLCRVQPTATAHHDRLASTVAAALESALGLRCAVAIVAHLPEDGPRFVDERR